MESTLHALLDATRVTGLTTSDSGRVVATAQMLDDTGTGWITQLSELFPAPEPARILTRAVKGASNPALTTRGRLFYLAAEEQEGLGQGLSLWHAPEEGGDPLVLARRPGGFSSVKTAGETLFAEASMHTQAHTEEDHAQLT